MHHNRFAYWPRYLARYLRYSMEYRGEFMGWKFTAPRFAFDKPDAKENEIMERRFLPLWRFSEDAPWGMLNASGSFPYMDTLYTVVYPDGRKRAEKLNPLTPEEQTIFKGDQVKILVGPDKGKIGIVASVMKMRRLVTVHNMNYRFMKSAYRGMNSLRRTEVPLHIDTEVTLVDPSDQAPCAAEWRIVESSGERIRVSNRTGREIPLPSLADMLDDLTNPSAYQPSEKDTRSDPATEVTYEPKLCSFEDEILESMQISNDQKRVKTFWY